jgi:DNA-binding transcriptional LysR family regulator
MSEVDLNLLRVFDALLEERSVTRASQRLGLTQSAVSHALGRLRHHFADPLFVRVPSGMAPTARALEVGPRVHAALTQLRAALQPSRFDPAASDRRFVIASGAYGCAILVPPVAAALASRAPRAELLIRPPEPDVVEQLDGRRADFAFRVDTGAPERVAATPLFSEDLVWAVRPDHPLPRNASLEALAAIPHVVISTRGPPAEARSTVADAAWESLRPFQEALAQRGLSQRIGVTVPDIYSAIAVTTRSDMATLAPRRLARMAESLGALRLIEPPNETPGLRISLMVLRERLSEPALAWMHDLLVEVGIAV